MVVQILSVLLPFANIAVKHVYETYVKQKKESGDWKSKEDGEEAFKSAVDFAKKLINNAVKRKEIKKKYLPSGADELDELIKAAVQEMVGKVTTRIRAATPQEMISCVETALKKVRKEYIEPYKKKNSSGYGDAEKQKAYKKCKDHVEVLMKYHNLKVNKEIIGSYILAISIEDEVMKISE